TGPATKTARPCASAFSERATAAFPKRCTEPASGVAAAMNRDRMMGLARRMLAMIDARTTDLAPASQREPVDAYTSPELFARERKAIFGQTPMFIGMSNEIPNAGDYFTRDFVDT